MYIEPMNNPTIPKEQKKIYAERKVEQEKPEKPLQNQIINLQVYQPPKPREPRPQPDPLSYMPTYKIGRAHV